MENIIPNGLKHLQAANLDEADKRECILSMHNEILKLSDQNVANTLLFDHLQRYTSINELNKEIKPTINNSIHWKSNLQNVDIQGMLKVDDSALKEMDQDLALYKKCLKPPVAPPPTQLKQEKISAYSFQRHNSREFNQPSNRFRTTRNEIDVSKLKKLNEEEIDAPKIGFGSARDEFKAQNVKNFNKFRATRNEVDVPSKLNKEENDAPPKTGFVTAREELKAQNAKKNGGNPSSSSSTSVQPPKRKYAMRGGLGKKFISPVLSNTDSDESGKSQEFDDAVTDERLKNIDPKMVELIKAEIMDVGTETHWNDIAGLTFAKTAIQEAVVWPMLRPDIFTGLRRPPKGILLFGPPGTGKTLIGKCVASQSKSTFFSISASSLTSKWIGDGEKMVRALFTVARCHQPAVIFIDEIDSLLTQRSDNEHESSRRIKTEFLVQLDGATTDGDERLLVIGATNRPQELDEAARRRFVKRLYIPLPEFEARLQLVEKLMGSERHDLNADNMSEICRLSDGYSGADMRSLCSEACLWPIRSINLSQIETIQAGEVRAVSMDDFRKALSRVRSSVSPNDLEQYVVWDKTYGSGCW